MQLDYAWLGQGLALDLANTYVPAQDADLLDAWPERTCWQAVGDEELSALRASVTALIDARIDSQPLPPAHRARVNAASLDNPELVTLSPTGSRHVRSPLIGAIARETITLIAGGARLARCPAPGCGMVYTRGRSQQQWCSPVCGNRARVARHANRRRAAENGIDDNGSRGVEVPSPDWPQRPPSKAEHPEPIER